MATAKKQGSEAELEASKESAREALDKLLEAKEHFRHAAEIAGLDVKAEALDQLVKGKEKADDLTSTAIEYAKDKPAQALAIAFLGGYVLSKLFSRN
ncbi:hypothetical protein PHACT_04035 [Pseudohongiella acticola]|jgi:ElaB/YqjD/DUF883 family membrane-anchored ribosome-binding protein|uniref:DUF883 domain-containing protein n=1 Tax=Pseudohongiella acticola TaxID=1524254 RepID=A0A1E8CJ27_9GAMM|nr:hypothetical protein [Pseudohongiella acticola]OFE12408.1 hypothetical protein PHACT_04035 [Pseudohongiella acticola]|tara:strand:+ start:205 stop:495 length:291 start_codon:yes stop_codon:yes gene_type:complete